ncbi:MAG TPA: bifunctional oligoribonuclease/PAP phosphatase NrnA [Longimicrobiales bacterium]|nr:bifunctional oligoribonuclease/PAP phosphatase NrnA [Longimicrobiales bacterium]
MTRWLDVPETRLATIDQARHVLAGAAHVVLATHVNADGDGAGSQAAAAAWLLATGRRCSIINPTPFPESYTFLLPEREVLAEYGTEAANEALDQADAFLVLDTAEPSRLGKLVRHFGDRPVVILDHHPVSDTVLRGTALQDPTACATGELVYDIVRRDLGPDAAWPDAAVIGIYTAIVSDTGSFRFANTSSRAHAIAADLIARGVDPEYVYRRVFASVPLRRIEILRAALATLEVDPVLPLSWISIPPEVSRTLNPGAEDVEGIVEYARSIQGTEIAILFRETADGATKVSFRSSGDADVNALARRFGGGGHAKASGAIIPRPLRKATGIVLDAAREVLRAYGAERAPEP